MLVYRDTEHEIDPSAALRRAAARLRDPDLDDATAALIEIGQVEAAFADILFPTADGLAPEADVLRAASLAAARALRALWRGHRSDPSGAAVVEAALRLPLPPALRVRVPEGYAHYALYPEAYAEAAAQVRRELQPERAVVLGLRSIGTSLSAMAAAELEAEGVAVESLTLRPRGHPYARRPVLTDRLAAWLRDRRDRLFLIADEGPGLSGTSLTGTADALVELGIPEGRILFLPSWQPDPARFVAGSARARWPRHRSICAPFEAVWDGFADGPLEDLGGGLWRARLFGAVGAPCVQPQHERRKYLGRDAEGPILLKFAGLGSHGDMTRARAERLAEAGFVPPVAGWRRGFLATRVLDGRPHRAGRADARLRRTAARYLGHLARTEPTGTAADPATLLEMIRVNVAEGLGPMWEARAAVVEDWAPAIAAAPAIRLDGRMLPHEWIRSASGDFKTDATDHHADHFFPGPHDIAWDVAAFAESFTLPAAITERFAHDVAVAAADPVLPSRLPFHRIAWLAFRLGYATMAASSLAGTPEAAGWEAEAARGRRRLRLAIRDAERVTRG